MVFTVAILRGGGGVIMGGFSFSYNYFLKGWLGLNFHRISKWFSSFSIPSNQHKRAIEGEKNIVDSSGIFMHQEYCLCKFRGR